MRNPNAIIIEVLEYHADEQLGADVRELRVHIEELRRLAGLVSSAAAKHTGESVRARAGDQTVTVDKIDRNAVGRLHNAAKLARALLDGGLCSMCTDAAESGVDVLDRVGTCAECGRVLGRL